jgi:hypothetical protein
MFLAIISEPATAAVAVGALVAVLLAAGRYVQRVQR